MRIEKPVVRPVVDQDRHGLDPAVALDESEHNHLAGRTPTALALSGLAMNYPIKTGGP